MILECGCGQKLKLKPELAGAVIRCPRCGSPSRVPKGPASDDQSADTRDEREAATLPRRKKRKPKNQTVDAAPGKASRAVRLNDTKPQAIRAPDPRAQLDQTVKIALAAGAVTIALLIGAVLFLMFREPEAASPQDGTTGVARQQRAIDKPEDNEPKSDVARTNPDAVGQALQPEEKVLNQAEPKPGAVDRKVAEAAIRPVAPERKEPVRENEPAVAGPDRVNDNDQVAVAELAPIKPEAPEKVEPKEAELPKPIGPDEPKVAENEPEPDAKKPPLEMGKPAVVDKPADQNGRQELTAKELQRFKAATVFIAAGNPRKDEDAGTGSGFVVAVQGKTVYVATNAHVVGRFKRVRAVFNSGSPGEQDLSAKVVMFKPENDLALLEVEVKPDTGIPRPISLAENPELRETLEVFVFGFPFGRLLGGGEDGNPAPTIGRGFVSSLRRNHANQVMAIQIDGALNPGNSGGPILDRQGRLLGIATATVPGAQIGIAVPTVDLRTLLGGHLTSMVVRTPKGTEEETELRFEARLQDPLEQSKTLSVVYHQRPKGWKKSKPIRVGQFVRIGKKGDKLEEFVLEKGKISHEGTLRLKGEQDRSSTYVLQPKVTGKDGTEQFLEPFEVRVGFGKARRTVKYEWGEEEESEEVMVGGGAPDKGDWLGGGGGGGADKKEPPAVRPLKPREGSVIRRMVEHPGGVQFGLVNVGDSSILPNVIWTPKGDAFVAMSSTGRMFRVDFPSFKVTKAVQLTSPGYWMGLSNRGIVVSVPGAQQLIVFSLDLKPLKKISVPTPRHFASGRGTRLVFVSGGSGGDALTVVDLGKGKAIKTLSARRINNEQRHLIKKHKNGVTLTGFGRPTMTPDGKFLFCEGFECLHRFTISKDRLVYDQMGPRIGSNVQRIEVSPDGRYVAMPSGGGNRVRDGHPPIGAYGTFVYRVSDITKALIGVTGGAYPRALAFDNIAGRIYGQNHDNHLIVFSTDGVKEMEFDFDGRNRSDQTSQLVVHPGGGRLLVVTEQQVYYAQFKKGKDAE